MAPHEILVKMHAGELTPEQAGDEFRKWYAEQGGKEPKLFDQQERRLLYGIPIVKVGESDE